MMPAFAILLAVAVSQQAPPLADLFVSKAGGFKIAMPTAPDEQTRNIPSPHGQIEVRYYLARQGGVHYIVSFSDYPRNQAEANPDKLLEEATIGPVRGVDGTLLSKKDRKIGQSPGKEIEFSFEGPEGSAALGRVRLYLAGTRMYSLTVIGPKESVAKASDAFFASFALARTISSPTTESTASPRARLASNAQPSAPEPFSSRAGGFRLALPADVKEQTQRGHSSLGAIESHMFTSQKDDVFYVASYADLPAEAARRDPATVLEIVLGEKVAGSRGTLNAKREVRLGSVPGREFEVTVGSAIATPSLARSRLFLDHGRLYQLTLIGPADAVRSKSGDGFLDSFSLTAPPTR
jgi:hypothetical protein